MEAARGYMNSIKQRAAEADQIVRGKETEGQDIQEDLIISERLDTIRRDAEYITAIAEGANTKVQTVTRGGGSNSAQRAALDSMMAYGRSYGEMKALQDQRRTKQQLQRGLGWQDGITVRANCDCNWRRG